MLEQIFLFLDQFEDGLWSYFGIPLFMLLGIYLTFQSNFFQIRKIPLVIKQFFSLMKTREHHERGVHPLKAFFAAVGGCIGVGNIAGVCTAIEIGGPGALVWLWITALAGMIVKYAEVYLGVRYRVPNEQGGYNGGPMYYLPKAFKIAGLPSLVCLLLCIYGVEVYQFRVVTDSIVTNLHFNQYVVILVLLALVIFAGSGGVRRVGNISSAIIPFFVVLYISMGLWVLGNNLAVIPQVIGEVFVSAFSGSAAVGGFWGSSIIMAMSQGVKRGCYTGDIGVGYASVIHSETSLKVPQEQASLAIFDIFIDTFAICTTSILIILVTGVWQQPVGSWMMVQTALGQYFPYMNFFMPLFFFLLGYSTINAYFCVGLKCAEFISPRHGRKAYFVYAVASLLTFSFVSVTQAQTVMTITNGLLLIINCCGIFFLRHQISYELKEFKGVTVHEPLTEELQPVVNVSKV